MIKFIYIFSYRLVHLKYVHLIILKFNKSSFDIMIIQNLSKLYYGSNSNLKNNFSSFPRSKKKLLTKCVIVFVRHKGLYLFFKIHNELDRKSTRLNSSHLPTSRMPSSA